MERSVRYYLKPLSQFTPMTDYEEPDQQPNPRRGWKRFFKRAMFVVLVLCLLIVLARWRIGRIGQRELVAISAHLDVTDPGWRLEEIEEVRRQAAPPDEKNSANIVIEFYKSIPADWDNNFASKGWEWGPTTNYQPSFFQFIWLVGSAKITAECRDTFRRKLLHPDIVGCPGGHFVVIQNENPSMILLPSIQNSRTVLGFLDFDARASVMEKKYNQAVSSVRASLVVTRAIGDEPFLISQLDRIILGRNAARSALQVLAWCEPTEGLTELQNELRKEADTPWLQYGLRGERGTINKWFECVESGKINVAELEGMRNQPAPVRAAASRAYSAFLPGDQAKAMLLLTAYIEASKLPVHEQKAAFAQIPIPPRPPEDFRYIVTNQVVLNCGRVANASIAARADLLTAATAIACERYRRATGRWPDSLSDIPRDILPEIALDPFNGKPIQYAELDDGVAIFSVGDEQDAWRRTNLDRNDPVLHLGRGWKLWNKELRRLPQPLPKSP